MIALSLLASLCFACTSALLPVQDAVEKPRGPIEATPAEIEFGDAFQGEVLFQEVRVKNTSDTAYPIGRILTSCGCTVPTLRLPDGSEVSVEGANGTEAIYVLEPGGSCMIDVHFKTAGKQGLVRQQITVQAIDPAIPRLSIPLTVRVSTPLSVDPPWVNFGNLAKGARVEKTVTLQALSLGDWKVTGFENQLSGRETPKWLRFEMLDTEGDSRKLKIVVDSPGAVGPFNERIKILTDHERVPSVDLSLAGIVEPSVKFDTGAQGPAQSLIFESVGPTAKATRTLKIMNTDPDHAYTLTNVEVVTGHDQSAFYATTIREIEAGVSYEVDLTVSGEVGGGVDESGSVKSPFFRGSLRLEAKHVDVPRKLIQFHGWVKPQARD